MSLVNWLCECAKINHSVHGAMGVPDPHVDDVSCFNDTVSKWYVSCFDDTVALNKTWEQRNSWCSLWMCRRVGLASANRLLVTSAHWKSLNFREHDYLDAARWQEETTEMWQWPPCWWWKYRWDNLWIMLWIVLVNVAQEGAEFGEIWVLKRQVREKQGTIKS